MEDNNNYGTTFFLHYNDQYFYKIISNSIKIVGTKVTSIL